MTGGYHRLIQVLTPITAAVADAVSLLGPNYTFPGTWYATAGLANALFALFVTKDHYELFGFHLAGTVIFSGLP